MSNSFKLPDPEGSSSSKYFLQFLRSRFPDPSSLFSADPRSQIRQPHDGEDFVVFYTELYVPKLKSSGVKLSNLTRFMILKSFREGVDVKVYYTLLYLLERIESSKFIKEYLLLEYVVIYLIMYLMTLTSEEREIVCNELFNTYPLLRNPSVYHELRPVYEKFYSEGIRLRTERSQGYHKLSSYRRGGGYRDQGNARESWKVQLPAPLETEEFTLIEEDPTRIQEFKKEVHHLLDLVWIQ